MTRLSSPMGKLSWSRSFARVNVLPCCSCQHGSERRLSKRLFRRWPDLRRLIIVGCFSLKRHLLVPLKVERFRSTAQRFDTAITSVLRTQIDGDHYEKYGYD